MEFYWYIIIAYAVISNLAAIIMTVHDKRAAQTGKWRVPERTLLITAALSGCVVMYLTMRLIHHKTHKRKFMLGIPLIFVAECAIGVFLYGLYAHWFF